MARAMTGMAAATPRVAVLVLLLAVGPALPAAGQSPHDRSMERIAVWPDGTGGYNVAAVWNFDVGATSTRDDLSTLVELRINGVVAGTITEGLVIDAGSGGVCGPDPPCTGGCGSATFNGGALALLCYPDGECTPGFCDCDCGEWIVSNFPGEPLAVGDEIMVILYPAPGALPDADPDNNRLATTFHGRRIGWNRGIQNAELIEVSSGHYDVQVTGGVGWETQPGWSNYDAEVALQVNGVIVGEQGVPTGVDGIYDQACFENGCGNTCGTVNGVPRYCDPYLWWTCGCFGGWITLFPGVGLDPGDEIMVILRPAPGALPELPGFADDDDRLPLTCCTSASVDADPGRVPEASLEQNRPNPFTARTSISFKLARPGDVVVDVFDASGRRVRTLLDRSLPAGNWSVSWDGRTSEGVAAPAGVYFCRLAAEGGTETRTMTLR